MRKKLIQKHIEREIINNDISSLTDEYIKEYDNLIYISEHAIIRYLERVLKIGTHTLRGSEKQKVDQYLRMSKMSGEALRSNILTREEQLEIVNNDLSRYIKGDYIYVIKRLTLVTILERT